MTVILEDEERELDSYALDVLPEIDRERFEQLHADNPRIDLWPMALEFEDEGDIPSEITPLRSVGHGRRESVIDIPKIPLSVGDTFVTRVFGGQSPPRFTYRVLGRTPGAPQSFDWLVVERLASPRQPPLERYRWTLTQQADGRRDQDELDARSPADALALAAKQAFGGFDVGEPTRKNPTRWTWKHLAGGTSLEVRRVLRSKKASP
jgi:hypothetical protein